MKLLEFAKIFVFMASLLLTIITIDDVVDNIIQYLKAEHICGDIQIFPVGLSIFTIFLWTVFYGLNLL